METVKGGLYAVGGKVVDAWGNVVDGYVVDSGKDSTEAIKKASKPKAAPKKPPESADKTPKV